MGIALSIEQAMLAQARPYILAAKAKDILRQEVSKGCRPEIAPQPVALEPTYEHIVGARDLTSPGDRPPWTFEEPASDEDILRLQVWTSPHQKCDWNRSELLLKQLCSVSYRVGVEIVGNQDRIALQILCHRRDLFLIRSAFLSEFEQCELSLVTDPMLGQVPQRQWQSTLLYDLYPPPPYSHLLTRPDELRSSPYAPIVTALADIPSSGVGIYQVVFEPVMPQHDWHRNVQILLDLEFAIKLMSGMPTPQRYAFQMPSGDLRQMAMDVETKAHNDKPFFSVAVRVAVVSSDNAADHLRSLATFKNLIQLGGRPLGLLTEADYRQVLGPHQIRAMFLQGLTYRPGFLANSWELTSLVHVPPPAITEHRELPMKALETLPASAGHDVRHTDRHMLLCWTVPAGPHPT